MATRRLRRGSLLGKYRLDRTIGEGGFAAVWRARDTVENRMVALKITHPGQVEEHGTSTVAWAVEHPWIAVGQGTLRGRPARSGGYETRHRTRG